MKLKTLKVNNLLGIRAAVIAFGERLTLIYGENGAGKTSIADAIRWALTGDATRGMTLGEMVRRGAKSADVELELDGTTVVRRQQRSGGSERQVGGVALKADEAMVALEKATGTNATTLQAALRPGALLDMAPAPLQRMLLALSGGSAEAEAIQEALRPLEHAFKATGLEPPKSIEAFATVASQAEGARKEAKRTAASAQADLARLPRPAGPAGDAAWACRGNGSGKKALTDKAAEVEAALEKATAEAGAIEGASAEQLRVTRARITQLQAKEKPKGDAESLRAKLKGLQDSLGVAGEARGSAKARLEGLEARLRGLRAAAKPGTPVGPAQVAARKDLLAAANAAVEAATKKLAAAEASGKAARAEVKSASVEGCNHSCQHHCPDLAAAEARLSKSKEDFVGARAEMEKASKAQTEAAAALRSAEAANAHAEAEELEKQVQALREQAADEQKVSAVAEEISKLQRLLAEHDAWELAQREVATLQERMASAPKLALVPPDTGPLKEQLRVVREAVAAYDAFERIAEAEAKVREAEAAIAAADAVAVGCGPTGAQRLKLLAGAVAPFVAAANEAFAVLHPGATVAFEADGGLRLKLDGESFSPDALSRGQSAIFEYALQFAVAKLSKVGVLILDHAETVDERHRGAIKKLVAHANKAGIQVVMLSCAAAPPAEPKGIPTYVVTAGSVARLGGAS